MQSTLAAAPPACRNWVRNCASSMTMRRVPEPLQNTSQQFAPVGAGAPEITKIDESLALMAAAEACTKAAKSAGLTPAATFHSRSRFASFQISMAPIWPG